jgi:hypothetical protein
MCRVRRIVHFDDDKYIAPEIVLRLLQVIVVARTDILTC